MKRWIYMMCSMLVFGFTSCVQDVDDVFSESATERVQRVVGEVQTLLKSQQYGWSMEYYPHAQQGYGGWALAMKFEENDEVIVSSEWREKPTEQCKSLYSIKTDMGPTLNFDTYNELFHYFADPDPHGYSHFGFYESALKAGYGFEGDYEFVIQSYSEDEVVLKGKKTKNVMYLRPLQKPIEEYMQDIYDLNQSIEDGLPAGTIAFRGMIDGKELSLEFDNARHFAATYGGEEVGKASFCLTPAGMNFYAPLEVAGRTLQHFSFVGNAFTCTDEGAEDVVLNAYKDPAFLAYEEFLGTYDMAYDGAVNEVTVVSHKEGESFLIKGFSPHFDVVMEYNSDEGKCYIYSQKVATENGRDIWIAAWDSQKGQLTWGTDKGMVAEWNQDYDNFVLTFRDFGSWEKYVIYGWYYYSFDAGGMENGAFFKEWGSNYFCAQLKTLTKK